MNVCYISVVSNEWKTYHRELETMPIVPSSNVRCHFDSCTRMIPSLEIMTTSRWTIRIVAQSVGRDMELSRTRIRLVLRRHLFSCATGCLFASVIHVAASSLLT